MSLLKSLKGFYSLCYGVGELVREGVGEITSATIREATVYQAVCPFPYQP